MPTFKVGKTYDRKTQIHGPLGGPGSGNATAGITKVNGVQCVFWNPYLKLYLNRWLSEPAEFIYSGDGKRGDMRETRSTNAGLIQCEDTGNDVCVFYKVARSGSEWKYLGKYQVVQHAPGASLDDDGNWRRDLRFHFRAAEPLEIRAIGELPIVKPSAPPSSPTEAELWEILSKAQRGKDFTRKRRTRVNRKKRESDPLKTMYVLARVTYFGGACELCEVKPDWAASNGFPHYQAHHLHADIDAVDWIAGICGTCHDRLHHSTDREDATMKLRKVVAERHELLGRPRSVLGPHEPTTLSGQLECFSASL